MGIGFGIFLIAIGAILTWAVTKSPNGVNIHVVGVILMGAGLAGILLDMLWWHSWRRGMYWRRTYAEPPVADPYGRYPARQPRTRTVVEEEEVPPAGPPPAGPPPP
jgi:hypothetical protein